MRGTAPEHAVAAIELAAANSAGNAVQAQLFYNSPTLPVDSCIRRTEKASILLKSLTNSTLTNCSS